MPLEGALSTIFRFEYNEIPSHQGVRRSRGSRIYKCLHCAFSSKFKGNAVTHAKAKHRELLEEAQPSQASSSFIESNTQTSMESYFRTMPNDGTLRGLFNAQRYREAIVGLLTRRRIPFSAVEWEELKNLALACNPAIADCLITSRYQAMKIIDANYDLYTSQLKEHLQSARSMIHISTDLWSSPHRHSMLAVCAQWVDNSYMLRKALLGMPECQFSHSGEAQAALIMTVIQSFGISNIGYHIGDNASSNDTCLEALAIKLKAELEVSQLPILSHIRLI